MTAAIKTSFTPCVSGTKTQKGGAKSPQFYCPHPKGLDWARIRWTQCTRGRVMSPWSPEQKAPESLWTLGPGEGREKETGAGVERYHVQGEKYLSHSPCLGGVSRGVWGRNQMCRRAWLTQGARALAAAPSRRLQCLPVCQVWCRGRNTCQEKPGHCLWLGLREHTLNLAWKQTPAFLVRAMNLGG